MPAVSCCCPLIPNTTGLHRNVWSLSSGRLSLWSIRYDVVKDLLRCTEILHLLPTLFLHAIYLLKKRMRGLKCSENLRDHQLNTLVKLNWYFPWVSQNQETQNYLKDQRKPCGKWILKRTPHVLWTPKSNRYSKYCGQKVYFYLPLTKKIMLHFTWHLPDPEDTYTYILLLIATRYMQK